MSVLRLSRMRVQSFQLAVQMLAVRAASVLALVMLLGVFGCASNKAPAPPSATDAAIYHGGKTQIGDSVRVTFPGAPNLNFSQIVRVDGMLDLALAGEIKAEGKTNEELEEELLKVFDADLIVKEINVSVDAALFPIFVSGAVRRPQKVMVNRSVTVLEAIIEAGGFEMDKANLRKVQVIRQESGKQRTFVIDVKKALDQAESSPFHLRPADVVHVPEKFIYF